MASVARRVQRHRLCAAAALTLFTAACAPKAVVSTPTAPRFPDYAMPAVPQALASPATVAAYETAWRLFQAGELDDAERRFERLGKQVPAFYPSSAALGYVALARKDPKKAIDRFGSALKVDDRYVPAWLGRGEAALLASQEPDALAAFEAALAIDPALPGVKQRVDVLKFGQVQGAVARAQAAEASGNLEAARAAYRQAVDASPQSGFLHRGLGEAARKAGDVAEAEVHLREAVRLDPSDAQALAGLGHLARTRGDDTAAVEIWTKAQELDPSLGLDGPIREARDRLALARLPEAYRRIGQSPRLTRAQLASLIGVRLRPLVDATPRTAASVMTDTRGHWAGEWITLVTERGWMSAFPNHTFQPESPLSRGDLAQTVARVLRTLGARQRGWLASWQQRQPTFPDLDTKHLTYPAAALAVSADVMRTAADGAFDVARGVAGTEGVETVARLEALMRKAGLDGSRAARP